MAIRGECNSFASPWRFFRILYFWFTIYNWEVRIDHWAKKKIPKAFMGLRVHWIRDLGFDGVIWLGFGRVSYKKDATVQTPLSIGRLINCILAHVYRTGIKAARRVNRGFWVWLIYLARDSVCFSPKKDIMLVKRHSISIFFVNCAYCTCFVYRKSPWKLQGDFQRGHSDQFLTESEEGPWTTSVLTGLLGDALGTLVDSFIQNHCPHNHPSSPHINVLRLGGGVQKMVWRIHLFRPVEWLLKRCHLVHQLIVSVKLQKMVWRIHLFRHVE